MKKTLLLVSLLTVLFATAQTQDSLFVWKAGVLLHKQSIKPADMDSITFKRPITPNGVNIPGPNVTDIDGNTYQSVSNCRQTWTKQNLNVSKYSDGTLIPQITDTTQWQNLTTGAWCYINNKTANGPIYGKLYNWYAVMGIYDAASAANPVLRKKLAPTGWHIPSDAEWSNLINCLDPKADGGNKLPNVAGGKMKAVGIYPSTGLWYVTNIGATNESGFTGLPGGALTDSNSIGYIGLYGNWWSSSEYDTTKAWSRTLSTVDGTINRVYFHNKNSCFSVRCVKD